MPIAQVVEISATSEESFEDAIQQGIEEAGQMFENINGAWIKEQKVKIKDGQIIEFNVNMQVTALMEEELARSSGKGSSSSGRNQRSNNDERENVVYAAKRQRRQE